MARLPGANALPLSWRRHDLRDGLGIDLRHRDRRASRRSPTGSLGTVAAFVAQHTTSTAQFVAPGNWRAAAAEAPAGSFTAVGFHVLDHMIEFGGSVRDVRCITSRVHPGPSDDTTTVMLRFRAGLRG